MTTTTTTPFPVGAAVLWTTPDGKNQRAGTVTGYDVAGKVVVELNVVLSVVADPADVVLA